MNEGEVRRRRERDVPPTGPTGDPGWYPDPRNPGQRRWWSGVSWSDQAEPADKPVASPPARRPGCVLLGVVVLILVVVAVIGFIVESPSFCMC
jgi:hypothetical protein